MISYQHELQDIYDAERQIMSALPAMGDAAMSQELKDAFTKHLQETKHQGERIEKLCRDLGIELKGKLCAGIAGIIQEGKDMIQQHQDPTWARDAALIGIAQRIEHYEMATYGCAKTYAEQLGKRDIAEVLDQIAEEEGETDRNLSDLAINCINQKAAS